MKDYKKIYEEFWKSIVEDKNGNLKKDRIMRELADYKFRLEQVPKVYMHVTGGKISKTNTLAYEVIREADDYYENLYKK